MRRCAGKLKPRTRGGVAGTGRGKTGSRGAPGTGVYPVGDRRRREPIGAGKRRLGRGDNLNDCTSEK